MSNIQKYIELIENRLPECLPVCAGELESVPEMMAYSMSGGGKRVRPLLCLEFAEACGGVPENALPFACAVEFVHTYSLIHDDLPCMDNDDMRRGKPSSHIKFGEANALLAGDALLTHAFGLIARAADEKKVTAEAAVKACAELSRLAGANGMIGGQIIDLRYENRPANGDVLILQDSLKTGALIESACVLGCLAAEADVEKLAAAREFAYSLGLAFQIKDDILEVSDEAPSSDEINNKATYLSVFGKKKAEELAADYTSKAVAALSVFGEKADEIKVIADMLLNRAK